MRTDDLINAIASDAAAGRLVLWMRIAIAVAVGGAIAGTWFAIDLGVRPDILDALLTWRFVLKLVVALAALGCALWTCNRLAQPDITLGDVAPALAFPPLLLAASILAELVALPTADWSMRAMGRYSSVCLASIPTLSIAPLVALLIALKTGAPRSPAIAGVAAGSSASALGAILYATHCPDDSPLFVGFWYALAMVPGLIAGALIGRVALRW